MPHHHLPQPVRSRAVAVNRVVRAAKATLPEVQAPEMKIAMRDAAMTSETEMLASPVTKN